MFKINRPQKAFTLIELLLAISIIALLTSLVLVVLSGTRAQGRDAVRKAETDSLRKALALYYADYGTYPTTTDWVSIEDTSDAEVASLRSKLQPYLPVPPSDPIFGTEKSAGVPYSYQYMSTTTDSGEIAYKLHAELETGTYASYETYSSGGEGIVYGGGGASWACGDTVTFTYKGSSVTYGTASSTGGECWMDRNLGASQVAVNATDTLAYGDLFQWGREDDLHQVRDPAPGIVEGGMTLTAQPGHANFITEQTAPFDWANNTWITRWTVAEDDPCPAGWRVPTYAELDTERASWSQQNLNGAYASPLKLTAGGARDCVSGSLDSSVGSSGYFWSSSVNDGAYAHTLYFLSGFAYLINGNRAYGFSVRCVQD